MLNPKKLIADTREMLRSNRYINLQVSYSSAVPKINSIKTLVGDSGFFIKVEYNREPDFTTVEFEFFDDREFQAAYDRLHEAGYGEEFHVLGFPSMLGVVEQQPEE